MRRLIAIILSGFACAAGAATLNPVQLLNPSGSTAGQAIISNGPSNAPTWQAVPLNGVTGVLPIANGGTNASTASTALSNLGGAALTGATFTGAITPSQTAGIVGTTTNNSANTGSVGEYVTASTQNTGATTAVPLNATMVSLTAGDWDVTGICRFTPNVTTTSTQWVCGISTTSNTFDTAATGISNYFLLSGIHADASAAQNISAPITRISISSTTTVYLVSQTTFATSTMMVSGFIRARRVR